MKNDWTEEEIQILKDNYADLSAEELERLVPRHPYRSMQQKANQLGLRKIGYWTPERQRLLKKIYPTASKKEIDEAFPGISNHSLQEYARRHGIKKVKPYGNNRKGDLSPLLKETLEAYYWAGYIAADGWISKTGQLVVVSSDDDDGHISKLARLLSTNYSIIDGKIQEHHNGTYRCKRQMRIAVQHEDFGTRLAEKFNFSNRKTYEPPDVKKWEHWSKNKRLSFLCGFIDGDGSRVKDLYGFRIQNHASWIDVHRFLLDGLDSSTKIDKTGYVLSHINKDGFKYLLSFVKKHNINVMERKWYELSDDRQERIGWTEKEVEILKKNYKNSTKEEICRLLPRHSYEHIQSKASRDGFVKYNANDWTVEEIKILTSNFELCSYKQLYELIPKHTIASIENKCSKLGLKRR